MERRRFGHGEHPSHFAEALLGVDQVGDRLDLGFALLDPIASGQSGVEDAVVDIASHLLRADQHAFDLRIVDGREVGAAAGGDVEAGPAEQIDGRVLQTALGNAEPQFHSLPPYTASGSYVFASRLCPLAIFQAAEEAALIAFVADAGADALPLSEGRHPDRNRSRFP